MSLGVNDINYYLQELHLISPDIEYSAVVGRDGTVFASTFQVDIHEERIPNMIPEVLSLSEQLVTSLLDGLLEQVFLRSDKGYIILMAVGQTAILVSLAQNRVKLGITFLDMRRAANEISRLV